MSREELDRLEGLICCQTFHLEHVPAGLPANLSDTTQKHPLIYLAGALWELDPMANAHHMMKIWDGLRSLGIASFCPHWALFQHVAAPRTRREWLAFDLAVLDHCDAVLRCDGTSGGADLAVERAVELGLPVFRSLTDLLVGHQSLRQAEPT